MKRTQSLLLALVLVLPLAGCAKKAAWRFELDTRYESDGYVSRSGIPLAEYDYELPRLLLLSVDAAPGEAPPEERLAVRDAFNAEIEHQRMLLLEEYGQMEQMAIDAYVESGESGTTPLGNRIGVKAVNRTDRLLSIRAEGSAYWGGAYPWSFVRVWNFDMETGALVTWREMTDRADALREALAACVLEQIGAAGLESSFYEGFTDTVERLDGCEIFLGEEGLVLIFGEQLLGPHAAGMPEFTIAYGEVSRYFNAYGNALIKKAG